LNDAGGGRGGLVAFAPNLRPLITAALDAIGKRCPPMRWKEDEGPPKKYGENRSAGKREGWRRGKRGRGPVERPAENRQ